MLLGRNGIVILALADAFDHGVIQRQIVIARTFGPRHFGAGQVLDEILGDDVLLARRDRHQGGSDQQQRKRQQCQPRGQARPAGKTVFGQRGTGLVHQVPPRS